MARSVPGNNLASKYTYSYFEEGSEEGAIEFRIKGGYDAASLNADGLPFAINDIVVSGVDTPDPDDTNSPARSLQKRGIISNIATAGTNSAGVDEFTGTLVSYSLYDPIYSADSDLDIHLQSDASITATISTVKVKRKDEVIDVFGTKEQTAAYLLQDQSSVTVNSEMFLRAVLTTFKYVIPSLVPQKEFTKRDYEQNLKFKDIADISSYLSTTIKDALNNSEVFMNVGAIIKKRNALSTEGGEGIFRERDFPDSPAVDQGLLIDDMAAWWNDPTKDDDISAPVQLNVASYTGPQIRHGDTVYQDIVDNDGNNIIINGLVVGTLNSGNSILVGWRGAINTSASPDLTLPSMPEPDHLFRDGPIYTIQGQYDSPMPTSPVGIAKITEATITINT